MMQEAESQFSTWLWLRSKARQRRTFNKVVRYSIPLPAVHLRDELLRQSIPSLSTNPFPQRNHFGCHAVLLFKPRRRLVDEKEGVELQRGRIIGLSPSVFPCREKQEGTHLATQKSLPVRVKSVLHSLVIGSLESKAQMQGVRGGRRTDGDRSWKGTTHRLGAPKPC